MIGSRCLKGSSRSAVAPVARSCRPAPFRAAMQQRRPVVSVRAMAVQANAIKVGSMMTDSSEYYRVLRTSDGDSLQLSSFKGKCPVVLFFYPKAATPGCTKEACRFRDEYERFTKVGAKVFGISSDSPEVNKAFAQANNLPFPLLTDASSILRKTFGIPADFLGLLPGRQTYVIDKNGKVILSFNDALNVEGHVDAALKALGA